MAVNQRHKSDGNKQKLSQAAQEARSRAEQIKDSGENVADQASDYMSRGASQFRELTHDHEGTAVFVALAAGFGVGVLIGSTLAMSQHQPPRWRDRIAAEGIGRRMLERMENMMPQAVTDFLQR